MDVRDGRGWEEVGLGLGWVAQVHGLRGGKGFEEGAVKGRPVRGGAFRGGAEEGPGRGLDRAETGLEGRGRAGGSRIGRLDACR